LKKMEQKIRYPDWLEQEVTFIEQIMNYLFSN